MYWVVALFSYSSILILFCILHTHKKAGQERFRSVTHAYYRDAHGMLIEKENKEFHVYYCFRICSKFVTAFGTRAFFHFPLFFNYNILWSKCFGRYACFSFLFIQKSFVFLLIFFLIFKKNVTCRQNVFSFNKVFFADLLVWNYTLYLFIG